MRFEGQQGQNILSTWRVSAHAKHADGMLKTWHEGSHLHRPGALQHSQNCFHLTVCERSPGPRHPQHLHFQVHLHTSSGVGEEGKRHDQTKHRCSLKFHPRPHVTTHSHNPCLHPPTAQVPPRALCAPVCCRQYSSVAVCMCVSRDQKTVLSNPRASLYRMNALPCGPCCGSAAARFIIPSNACLVYTIVMHIGR